MGGLTIPALLFADDVVLLAESPGDLGCLLETFTEFCNAKGLEINPQKSKILMLYDTEDKMEILIMNIPINEELAIKKILTECENYRYLGLNLIRKDTTLKTTIKS